MKNLFSALFSLLFASTAQASLVGDEMTATWIVQPYIFESVNFLGGGTAVDWIPEVMVKAEADRIIVDNVTGPATGLVAGVTWSFTGIDWNGGPGGITHVTVNTNYIGWDNSFLSFDTDSITVNFLNDVETGEFTGDLFELHINDAPAPVPLPAALPLFLTGLAALGYRLRKKN